MEITEKVSIIIPAYNAEKYVTQTINSILSQTYQNWELIVIDDGSIDLTASKIQDFLYDSRIKYYYQKNSGVSVARNKGISLAKGDYIAFIDADDAWEGDNLKQKVTLLEEMPEVDWVFSDVSNADANMEMTGDISIGVDDSMLSKMLLWNGAVVPFICSNIMMRRRCLNSGILFDPELSTIADQDFAIQLASQYTGKRIPVALVIYRVLPNSMSRSMPLMEKDHVSLYKKLKKNNSLFDSWSSKQKSFSNMFLVLAGSWWVNGNNKIRGTFWAIRAILTYPPNAWKAGKKLLGV